MVDQKQLDLQAAAQQAAQAAAGQGGAQVRAVECSLSDLLPAVHMSAAA